MGIKEEKMWLLCKINEKIIIQRKNTKNNLQECSI